MSKWLTRLFCLSLFVGLSLALLQLPNDDARLSPAVTRQLDASGVSNPVTAVLLNFRSYDTLLEIAVLLLALVGAWAIGQPRTAPATLDDAPLLIVLRLFLPPIILGAAYFLWVGASAPGGAFQGGAILAGGLILLLLGGRSPWLRRPLLHRFLLILGLTIFLMLTVLPSFSGHAFLQYPPEEAKIWILMIESAALISIAFTLTALFLGGPPRSPNS